MVGAGPQRNKSSTRVKFIMTSRLCIEVVQLSMGVELPRPNGSRATTTSQIPAGHYSPSHWPCLFVSQRLLPGGRKGSANRLNQDFSQCNTTSDCSEGWAAASPRAASRVARKDGVLFRQGLVTREHTAGWLRGLGHLNKWHTVTATVPSPTTQGQRRRVGQHSHCKDPACERVILNSVSPKP